MLTDCGGVSSGVGDEDVVEAAVLVASARGQAGGGARPVREAPVVRTQVQLKHT